MMLVGVSDEPLLRLRREVPAAADIAAKNLWTVPVCQVAFEE